jgi:hypothetical protein
VTRGVDDLLADLAEAADAAAELVRLLGHRAPRARQDPHSGRIGRHSTSPDTLSCGYSRPRMRKP